MLTETMPYKLSHTLVIALCLGLASAGNSLRHTRQHRCTLHDVDIFLVVNEASLPLMQHLLQSINSMIPCYGKLHVVADEKDVPKLQAWMNTDDERTQVHVFDDLVPPSLKHITGYILQAWLMMTADSLVSDNARHVMFTDADVVLGMPVARRLLFDDKDRPYVGFWDFKYQPQFNESCQSFLGDCTFGSSMAFMPFMFPVQVFAPMRQHLARKHGAVDFNAAFAKWSQTVGPEMVQKFSQFVVMGNYAATYMPDSIAVVHCPVQSQLTPDSQCATWTPVGAHLGWKYCGYLESCPPGIQTQSSGEQFGIYRKYEASYIEDVQNITFSANCLKHLLYEGEVQRGCTQEDTAMVNQKMLPYPTLPDRVSAKVVEIIKAEVSHL
jgi:hypothetical protein